MTTTTANHPIEPRAQIALGVLDQRPESDSAFKARRHTGVPSFCFVDFDTLPGSGLARQNQLVPNKRYPGAPTVLPFSAATLWRRVADGSFPAPVRMGRITAWKVSDVRAWLAAQAEGQGDAA